MEVVVQLFNFLELAFPFFNNTGSHLLIFAAYNRLSVICSPRVLPGNASWFHFSLSLPKEAGYCLLHILTTQLHQAFHKLQITVCIIQRPKT